MSQGAAILKKHGSQSRRNYETAERRSSSPAPRGGHIKPRLYRWPTPRDKLGASNRQAEKRILRPILRTFLPSRSILAIFTSFSCTASRNGIAVSYAIGVMLIEKLRRHYRNHIVRPLEETKKKLLRNE